jgi:energy-coupling factor transport system ATP-binding protein
MVALASIAAMDTPILVLDEPTVGLDAEATGRVLDWLTARQRAGVTVLLITHDMELIAARAERVIVLNQGRITADGAPAEVFRQSDVLRAAGLEAPFAVRLAEAMDAPKIAADLTPEGAGQQWREAIR